MDALKYEDFYNVNDSQSNITEEYEKKNRRSELDIKKMRKKIKFILIKLQELEN